ncbi:hypothetical protein GBZ26_01225 [Azospirillum formosense]|uniref:Uncharacterized protein n=1 Tax=Azospirillum formosense TaxID=861533 RepID=A0ABX2KSQ7_9PROT|nr:hypothetical protein [Azospirillum formosense]MBY3756168.1 hypothetical protein [Azospirillum formosense]NUB17849.1 hypothetical protein [Azospirillum formosense]
MGISDVSASLFQAASAASVPAKPAAAKAGATDGTAPAASSKTDKVDLSDLASALKGDALDLFTNLSADDRTSLGKLVSSGALSADELNDALSSALKSERKKAFWQSAKEDADAGRSPDGVARQQKMQGISDRMLTEMETRRAAMFASGMSAEDRMAATVQLNEEMKALQNTWDQLAGIGKPMTAYTLKGGDERFFATSKEQAAGQKLADMGFQSGSFDKVLSTLAKGFAQKYVSEEGKREITIGPAVK